MKHPGLINTVIKDNNDFFQWSEKNFAKIQIIIEKYPPGRQQSLSLIHISEPTRPY